MNRNKSYLLIDKIRNEYFYTDDIFDDFEGCSVACIDKEDLEKELNNFYQELKDNFGNNIKDYTVIETQSDEHLQELVNRIREEEL